MREKSNTPGEDTLHQFIDGVLDEDSRLDFVDWLNENEEDAERVEAYQRQNHLMRALRRGLNVGSSQDFCPELQANIVAQMHKTPSWRQPWVTAIAASVALIAVISMMAYTVDFRPIAKSSPNEPSAGIADAEPMVAGGFGASHSVTQRLDHHLAIEDDYRAAGGDADGIDSFREGVRFPFRPQFAEPGFMPEQPLQWFNEHMTDRMIRQPDLSGFGLTFSKIKVLSDKPSPAVHLTYVDDNGRPFELFAGILEGNFNQAVLLPADGYMSMHWVLGEIHFALVGPYDSPQLMNVAATVSEAVESIIDTPSANGGLFPDGGIEAPGLPGNGDDILIAPDAIIREEVILRPMPRPARRGEALPVEPHQAVPPVEAEEEPQKL